LPPPVTIVMNSEDDLNRDLVRALDCDDYRERKQDIIPAISGRWKGGKEMAVYAKPAKKTEYELPPEGVPIDATLVEVKDLGEVD
jgi:hypothetical protein